MKSFIWIILILLTIIKYNVGEIQILHAIWFKMVPIQRWYSVPSFGQLSTKLCVAQVWCLTEGSKVSYHYCCLVWNKHKILKSVGYHLVECKARITKMCRLCEFVVPVFGRFTFKCVLYNFNGAWLPCTYGPVDVIHTCFIAWRC